MEVYTPIIFPGSSEIEGVFEIYEYYHPTAHRVDELRRWVFGSIALGFLLLYVTLVSIVWRAWTTIRSQRTKLESFNAQLEDQVQERTTDLRYALKEVTGSRADLEIQIDERQRAEETAERLAEESDILAAIGRIISSSLDIDAVCEPFSKFQRSYVLIKIRAKSYAASFFHRTGNKATSRAERIINCGFVSR